jgi:hypothetical protein
MKKTLPDGTMIFSVAPAEIPEGYEATGDPRVFVLKMRECKYRTFETINKSCCGRVNLLFCNALGERTTRKKCHECGII